MNWYNVLHRLQHWLLFTSDAEIACIRVLGLNELRLKKTP